MNKVSSGLLIFCLLMLFVSAVRAKHSDGNSQHFIVSGVIVNSDNANLIERFVKYISSQSGYLMIPVYVNNYTDLSTAMQANPKAIAWTCGAPYVQDHAVDGQQLVAVPLFNHSPTYYSVILARVGHSEKNLADFKGGVLAYSDPRSNSGFLSPRYALYKQGIKMDSHFRLLLNAGNHEGSIDALLNGLADVAAVDEYIWVAYNKAHPQVKSKLRELNRMGPYPFTPIVAGAKVSQTTINKISAALLGMSENPTGIALLKEFSFNGFVFKNNDFYKPIKDMLGEVTIKGRR